MTAQTRHVSTVPLRAVEQANAPGQKPDNVGVAVALLTLSGSAGRSCVIEVACVRPIRRAAHMEPCKMSFPSEAHGPKHSHRLLGTSGACRSSLGGFAASFGNAHSSADSFRIEACLGAGPLENRHHHNSHCFQRQRVRKDPRRPQPRRRCQHARWRLRLLGGGLWEEGNGEGHLWLCPRGAPGAPCRSWGAFVGLKVGRSEIRPESGDASSERSSRRFSNSGRVVSSRSGRSARCLQHRREIPSPSSER